MAQAGQQTRSTTESHGGPPLFKVLVLARPKVQARDIPLPSGTLVNDRSPGHQSGPAWGFALMLWGRNLVVWTRVS